MLHNPYIIIHASYLTNACGISYRACFACVPFSSSLATSSFVKTPYSEKQTQRKRKQTPSQPFCKRSIASRQYTAAFPNPPSNPHPTQRRTTASTRPTPSRLPSTSNHSRCSLPHVSHPLLTLLSASSR